MFKKIFYIYINDQENLTPKLTDTFSHTVVLGQQLQCDSFKMTKNIDKVSLAWGGKLNSIINNVIFELGF